MNLFFHSLAPGVKSQALFKELSLHLGNDRIEELPNSKGLSTPLPLSLRSGDVVFFHIENPNQLEALLSVKDIFECFRRVIILGLSEPSMDLLQLCQRLSPRYIAYGKNSTEQAAAVAEKMLSSCSLPGNYETLYR